MRTSRLLADNLLGFIAHRDLIVMRRCNTWMAPRWIRLWMILASRGGDGWLWYAILLSVLLFGGADRFYAAGAAASAAAIGVCVFLVLKKAANRPRPCAIAPHAWATLLPPDRFSFPSGHTMTAFAVATPIMFFYPDLGFGLGFCAVSVAASRILLGMHFLSDVLAGALLGVVLGLVTVSAI
jgi:undecaprenyl-diphosphatase